MQRFQDHARPRTDPGAVRNTNASVVPYARIAVYLAETTTLATLYDDNLITPTAKPTNPFTADRFGYFHFYAADGRYDIYVSGGTPAIADPYWLRDVSLGDRSPVTRDGGTATMAGVNSGYTAAGDPIVDYVIPTALVAAEDLPSLEVGNPPGPSSDFQVIFGNLLVLPKIRYPVGAGKRFDDFGGWRPAFYLRDTWVDSVTPAAGTDFNRYDGEGSPKGYLGGGLVITDANDTCELAFDRFDTDSTGAKIYPTADQSIGRIYWRAYTDQGSDRGAIKQRCGEIYLRYIHPTSGTLTQPGGTLQLGFSRAGSASSDREVILELGVQDNDGIHTGFKIWRGVWPAGALKNINAETLKVSEMLTLSTAAATIAGGLTRFVGAGNVNASEGSVGIPVPKARTAKSLYVRASDAPVGAETFAYTVTKNGADTALTKTLTGASQQDSDLVNSVTFAAGDRIAVKIVTSAGAAVTTHVVTLEWADATYYLTETT